MITLEQCKIVTQWLNKLYEQHDPVMRSILQTYESWWSLYDRIQFRSRNFHLYNKDDNIEYISSCPYPKNLIMIVCKNSSMPYMTYNDRFDSAFDKFIKATTLPELQIILEARFKDCMEYSDMERMFKYNKTVYADIIDMYIKLLIDNIKQWLPDEDIDRYQKENFYSYMHTFFNTYEYPKNIYMDICFNHIVLHHRYKDIPHSCFDKEFYESSYNDIVAHNVVAAIHSFISDERDRSVIKSFYRGSSIREIRKKYKTTMDYRNINHMIEYLANLDKKYHFTSDAEILPLPWSKKFNRVDKFIIQNPQCIGILPNQYDNTDVEKIQTYLSAISDTLDCLN